MWIPGRFFDTSRRHERFRVSRLFVWAGILVLACTNGCIVTDKIEFEDWVNHQIAIERDKPNTPTVTRDKDESVLFSVLVTDPDVVDLDDNPIAARLEVQVDNWSDVRTSNCDPPDLVVPSDATAEDPPSFSISCYVTPADTGMGEHNLLYVRVVVSDLGFAPNGGDPVAGATTAEMLWFLAVTETAP